MKYALLQVTSTHQMWPSKAEGARLWKAFKEGGTSHSKFASTLPYIMARCEREGVPYILKAHPGVGYWIEPGEAP